MKVLITLALLLLMYQLFFLGPPRIEGLEEAQTELSVLREELAEFRAQTVAVCKLAGVSRDIAFVIPNDVTYCYIAREAEWRESFEDEHLG
jgi:type II secretory pathway component PulM